MNTLLRSASKRALFVAILFIAGCANLSRTDAELDPKSPRWHGRLALKVQSSPAQAFSANFDLQGSAHTGRLTFTTPLGSTLARLQWSADAATLHANGNSLQFDSLGALSRHATGTDLPIASLFSWLDGEVLPTPGWEVDLRDIRDGRLTARRLGPDAPADLKIILDHE